MTIIIAFRAALRHFGFTVAEVTAIKHEGFDMMNNIDLGTKLGFNTMLKTLQERTVITTQYRAGNNVVTNAPVVVSARTDHIFYTLRLWIKIMSAQFRSIAS